MNSFQYLAPIASFRYVTPSSTDELLEELAKYGSEAKLIAGGTDLMIALKQRLINTKVVIDLSPLRSKLSGVSLKDEAVELLNQNAKQICIIGKVAEKLHENEINGVPLTNDVRRIVSMIMKWPH